MWCTVGVYSVCVCVCVCLGVHDPTLRYTLVTEKKTWYDAQSYCRENYTDLVSIMNEGEKEEVKNKGMNSTTPYWIGLLYDDWEWGDGGRSVYRNWFKLKLNSDIYYYPQAGEAVPVLMQNGMLTVPPGNENLYTFCSKESFHLINETKTWEQALDYCNKNYHGLLRLESEADHKIVEQKLSRIVKPVSGPVWVGLRQSRLFGFWLWTNGMPVQWSNWEGYRQPKQPLSNHCGAMATQKGDFKWSDKDCMSTRYFICEG
uniref:C-type lectin domain-containing protein n=1 Tax=Hucho hucho TaxID=62062 RepID=A0A4W5NEM2_9TELE